MTENNYNYNYQRAVKHGKHHWVTSRKDLDSKSFPKLCTCRVAKIVLMAVAKGVSKSKIWVRTPLQICSLSKLSGNALPTSFLDYSTQICPQQVYNCRSCPLYGCAKI
jgi:hypothetical protein